MTYEEFKKKYPSKEFGELPIMVKRECDYEQSDEKNDWGGYKITEQVIDHGWTIELPHQCDEWVIGGLEDALKFKDSLEEAIEWIKDN